MGWAAAIPAIMAVHQERTGANKAERQNRISAAMGQPSAGSNNAQGTEASSKLIEMLGNAAVKKYGKKDEVPQSQTQNKPLVDMSGIKDDYMTSWKG